MPISRVPDNVPPTLKDTSRLGLAIRQSKVVILRAQRLVGWARTPRAFAKAPHASQSERVLLHEVVVDVKGTQSHPSLEAGKLRNVRIAAAHFDGRLLTSQTGFSFWRLLGRPTRRRGFLAGTEIRDGCVVPTVGGGLCMLSGALFRLAAELDWLIVERHGHTISAEDSAKVDATVFWPFVDLRFAPRSESVVLRVHVRDGMLRVAAFGEPKARVTQLRVWREHVDLHPNGVRESRIMRQRDVGEPEELGVDAQREAPEGLRRNCITCEEHQCQARAEFVEVL